MAKDVNIHLKTEGSEQANRELERTAQATRKVGDATESAGKRGATATRNAVEQMSSYAKQAAAAVGIGALTKALRENSEAMQENAEIAASQQRRITRLQFMGDFFAEHPEARAEVRAYAEFGRRPAEEVADAWYNLRSKGAFLDDEAQHGMLQEALEISRTDPDVGVDTLVDMFLLYSKKTGERDANRIQNVIKQTIAEAGAGAKDVASQMPKFLPWGIAGGMSGAESAGLWAYATTELGDAGEATTALRMVYQGLEGQWTPAQKRLMRRLGVKPGMSFMEKLEALGGKDLSVAQLDVLAGRGGAMLSSLTKNIEDAKAAMGRITAVDRGDIDLTAAAIEDVFGKDAVAKMVEDIQGLDVEIENIRAGDVNALEWDHHIKQHEAMLRRKGASEAKIGLQTRILRAAAAMGFKLQEAELGGGEQIQVQPQAMPAPAAATPTQVNYIYDHSSHYSPVAGSGEDRAIGERFSQD